MFLDITAIKDYNNVNILKNLSIGLDVSKIILFLSDDVANSEVYISKLINFGIYNFAKTEEELKYLYENPNSYKDVAHLQKNEESYLINSKLENNISSFSDDFISNNQIIIGFKNFTSHAGATSLIYMLKKQLFNNYNVIAIEINKKDFMFFNDKDMISCKSSELNEILSKYRNIASVILIDLNDLDNIISHNICSDIIYLMEASTLMINKSVMLDKNCFINILDKNVVLNCSLLNQKDVRQLEFEAGIKFFDVLPPLNDRIDNSDILIPFLSKFGLYKKVD